MKSAILIASAALSLGLEMALAQEATRPPATPVPDVQQTAPGANQSTYPIDLPTTLRLAGAKNLDVQLARTVVDEAHANYASAVEKFIPALIPTASYLHHSGR